MLEPKIKSLFIKGLTLNASLIIFICSLIFSFTAIDKSFAASAKLILLSPHQESIQKEFTTGFKRWYKEKYKADVEMVWLDRWHIKYH